MSVENGEGALHGVINLEGALHATPHRFHGIIFYCYFPNLIEACAAASLAIGTLNGEQLT